MAVDAEDDLLMSDHKEVIQTFARTALELHVANGLITDTRQLRQWVTATIHHAAYRKVIEDLHPDSPGFLTALGAEIKSLADELLCVANDLRGAELRPTGT